VPLPHSARAGGGLCQRLSRHALPGAALHSLFRRSAGRHQSGAVCRRCHRARAEYRRLYVGIDPRRDPERRPRPDGSRALHRFRTRPDHAARRAAAGGAADDPPAWRQCHSSFERLGAGFHHFGGRADLYRAALYRLDLQAVRDFRRRRHSLHDHHLCRGARGRSSRQALCGAVREDWMQALDFSIVTPYTDLLLTGLWWTLVLTVASAFLSFVLGIAFALVVLYAPAILAWPVRFFMWLFMGTPLLLQLFLIYFGLVQIGIDIPALGAGIIGLSLHFAVYNADIIRAGIVAVDPGQMEGARSIGFSHGQALRYVVIPQAIRNTIPPI